MYKDLTSYPLLSPVTTLFFYLKSCQLVLAWILLSECFKSEGQIYVTKFCSSLNMYYQRDADIAFGSYMRLLKWRSLILHLHLTNLSWAWDCYFWEITNQRVFYFIMPMVDKASLLSHKIRSFLLGEKKKTLHPKAISHHQLNSLHNISARTVTFFTYKYNKLPNNSEIVFKTFTISDFKKLKVCHPQIPKSTLCGTTFCCQLQVFWDIILSGF